MATDVWLRGKGDGVKTDIPTPVACFSKPQSTRAEALQVTELNRIAVIAWLESRHCGVRAAFTSDGLLIMVDKERAPRAAIIGDWVLCTRLGGVYVMQDDLFRYLFVVTTSSRKQTRRHT